MSVSISTRGILEKDNYFEEMYRLKQLCDKLNTSLPKEVEKYFDQFYDFDELGGRISIPVVERDVDCGNEIIVDISKLPVGVKTIVFGMYY